MPTRSTLNRELMTQLEAGDAELAAFVDAMQRTGTGDLAHYRRAREHYRRAALIAQALDLSKREAIGLLQAGQVPRDVSGALAQLLDLLAAPPLTAA